MFRFFETLISPYPPDDGTRPPKRLLAFLYYYSRPALPYLALMAVLTAVLSVLEIGFIQFSGDLIDWMGKADRAAFVSQYAGSLWFWALVVLIAVPLLTLFASLFQFQTTFGVYPMLVRWRAHRHMLGQSLSFFNDEFAGRVSQKVMQTALAVRDTVSPLNVTIPADPVAGTAARQVMGGLIFAGQNGAKTQTGNVPAIKYSPRVGMAYTINDRTVLRAGYKPPGSNGAPPTSCAAMSRSRAASRRCSRPRISPKPSACPSRCITAATR